MIKNLFSCLMYNEIEMGISYFVCTHHFSMLLECFFFAFIFLCSKTEFSLINSIPISIHINAIIMPFLAPIHQKIDELMNIIWESNLQKIRIRIRQSEMNMIPLNAIHVNVNSFPLLSRIDSIMMKRLD